MQTRVHRLLGLIFLGFFSPSALATPQAKDREIRAKKVSSTEIQIDGHLTEEHWKTAERSGDFLERTPNPGDTPPVKTEVAVLYSDDAIYVGIWNSLSPNERPRSLELRRDSYRIWNDDAVTLKFDVAHDRRTSINLGVNAEGAQVDAMALNNGRSFRREFDAVWSAKSQVTDGLWTIEYRIPYSALGMTATNTPKRIVGFNVSRDHNKRTATYDWSLLPPEMGASAASHYGDILGLDEAGATGRSVEILPFSLVSYPSEDEWSGGWGDLRAGFDLKTRLGQDFWMEGTAFTDFAEVDLDDELVNLTRFPLFLPEKRPFFLSGLSVFESGKRGRSQPFFSRRMGLNPDGEQVPILGGLKMYGRLEGLDVGVLNVTTASQGEYPMLNDTVMRTRHRFDGGSSIGAIFTSRNAIHSDESTVHQHTVGVDANAALMNQRLDLYGFVAMSLDENAEEEQGTSLALEIDYRGRIWQPELSVLRTDSAYDPALGFVRRRDALELNAESPFTFRMKDGTWSLAEVEIDGGAILRASDQEYLGGNTTISGYLRARNGWRLRSSVTYLEDVVDAEDELPTGEVIRPDTYTGSQLYLGLGSPNSRNPAVWVDYLYDAAFYGGTRHSVGPELSSYLGKHFRLALAVNTSIFQLPNEEQSKATTMNGGLTIAFSPTLFWEHNLQANTVDESGRILSRIRWRYLPGSDVFIVLQQDAEWGDQFTTTEPRAILKLTYWWDAVL